MNHYPHHIGDFARKTKGLTLTERGAYRELLDQYYVSESPLPLDRREVYRLAVAATPAERKAVDYVLGKYFVEKPDGWHNKRADEEVDLYRKRVRAGQIGAKERWQTDSTLDGKPIAQAVANGCGGDSISMPTKNQEPKTNAVSSESPPKTQPCAREKDGHKNGLQVKNIASFSDWRVNDTSAMLKAASLNIHARPGESYEALRRRITEAETERARGKA